MPIDFSKYGSTSTSEKKKEKKSGIGVDFSKYQQPQEPEMSERIASGQLPSFDVRKSQLLQEAAKLPELPAQKEKPFLVRAQEKLYEKTLEPIQSKLMRFAASAAGGVGKKILGGEQTPEFIKAPWQEALQPPQTTGEKIADIAGEFYGMAGPIGGAYATGGRLAAGGLARLAPNAPRLLQAGVRGAGAGATYGTARETAEALSGEKQSLGGRIGDIALDTALFGAGDVAVGALSPLAKRVINSFIKKPKAPVTEILGLPAPKPLMLREGRAPSGPVIQAPGEIKTFALPEPKVLAPTKARIESRPNVYAQKLESLFQTAREQGLPAGREYEALQDLWGRMAERTDPGLDELISLASQPAKRPATPDLITRTKGYQAAREVAGVPLPVKSLADRYQTFVGEAAGPTTKVGFRSAVERLKPEQVEAIIPQRKFATEVQQITRPETPVQGQQERGFVTTLKESPKTPETLRERLGAAYTPITNKATVAAANKRIEKDLEDAASFVMGKSRFTAEKVTVAHRLIDEFQKSGNIKRAVDVAEKIAEEGTKAGQSIQAFSIYNRLTPEGILVHANRVAQRANEKISVFGKESKVTPEIAANLTDLATTTQRMTGVKDLSTNVMDIVERAKTGQMLTDSEQQTIKQFVNEARQFVKETTRKPSMRPPKTPQDKRIRDNVISFLDAQEQAAKERLRAKGIQISSTPLDVYADYAIIGAAKMAKGTVKFADWSEQMVKDLGDGIRPYLAQLYERSVETFNQSTKHVSQETISSAERITERMIKNKKIEGQEAEGLRQLAQKVSRLSGDAKDTASQDLQVILQSLEKSSGLQKVSVTQTIAQLLNPKTLVRNVVGNELFYRLERLNKYVSTPIDITRSKITKGERTVTFRTNNQGEYWQNWVKGTIAGWKGVNPEGLATQFDIRPQTFNSKWNPMTYLEKSLGASIRGFDYAAYKRAVNETVGELATLRAINEGKGGDKSLIEKYIREADDNILKIADEYGKYSTFQDNNVLSVGLQKLKRGLNLGKDFGIGDLVLKYPRTPGALLMRALDYSPAGFLRSIGIAARPMLRKGAEPNTREAVNALSRAITGTVGLTGLGYFLADVGIITGQASKDKDVRELQRMTGQGQYQVNLSALKRWVLSGFDTGAAKLQEDDQLYTYDWAQPVAISLSIGANIQKNIKEGKGVTSGLAGTAFSSFSGGVNTLVEQSVLQGLKRAAEGYPGQTVTDKITSILSEVPASFAPTALKQVSQLTDNLQRETYDPSKLQESINKLKVKLPGFAQQLPQRYTTLGRPKETFQEGGNTLFNVFLNPGFASKYHLTPEAKLVVDLIHETGDVSVAPRVPGKKITIRLPRGKSESRALTTEQFTRLQQLTGEDTRKRLERINPNMNNDAKIRAIVKALGDAGERAREQLKKEMGVK